MNGTRLRKAIKDARNDPTILTRIIHTIYREAHEYESRLIELRATEATLKATVSDLNSKCEAQKMRLDEPKEKERVIVKVDQLKTSWLDFFVEGDVDDELIDYVSIIEFENIAKQRMAQLTELVQRVNQPLTEEQLLSTRATLVPHLDLELGLALQAIKPNDRDAKRLLCRRLRYFSDFKLKLGGKARS